MGASVKIMLSYDYCHFEICKSTDQVVTDEQIDELRKDCQRLADKAVKQYQIAKECANKRFNAKYEKERIAEKASEILRKPEGERTKEELALIRLIEDENFKKRFEYNYDYEDDFDESTLESREDGSLPF